MVLIKAREMVLELQLELSTFEVMLSFEVYEARELERECERGRQHARGEGVCVCVCVSVCTEFKGCAQRGVLMQLVIPFNVCVCVRHTHR